MLNITTLCLCCLMFGSFISNKGYNFNISVDYTVEAVTQKVSGNANKHENDSSMFRVPAKLKESYDRYKKCSGIKFLFKLTLFVFFAIPISVIAFLLGVLLLPLEILVFVFMAFFYKNFFWLTMIITWKYVVLFVAIF